MKANQERAKSPHIEGGTVEAALRADRRNPAWKPEPCLIPRAEMRRIVLEMIG
ncbi:hypothetical protein ACUN0C_10085 [Faunimonas sp. B44]|uniref:hypothetical protein n=1 Tax=Faunimonas sp. B44 TaxID=3461493 RepID=UPI004043A0E2